MKRYLLYGMTMGLLLVSIPATAQMRIKRSIDDGKTMIMLTPQYLYIDQFRVEVDRKINGKHWLSLAPHYAQNFDRHQEHSGIGLVLTYKYTFNTTTYLGGGPQLTYSSYENYAFDDQIQADRWLYKSKVMKYGANVVVGHYLRAYPNLFIDLYYGFGYRFSHVNSSDGNGHTYEKNFLDYGSTGLVPIIGLRLGVML